MNILFATSHFGFLRNFEHALAELARRGHRIHLLADRQERLGGMRTVENLQAACPGAFSWSFAPSPKNWSWHALGTTLRLCLDYWRYLGPPYERASALRRRAAGQVPRIAVRIGDSRLLGSRPAMALLKPLARAMERSVPPSPHVDRILDDRNPDVVMVTPLLYFGSQQVDYVRSARRRGIPVMLCVGSWDHLTTKGMIHEIPDRVTVWNEAQRTEAHDLHGVRPEIVRVTGAQAYDHWFTGSPTLSREEFCAKVGLPADCSILLYLCSSPFIAPYEVGFVHRWIEGIRAHQDPGLRSAAIHVRPHPQNAEQWKDVDLSSCGPVAIWPRAGSNPVDSVARAEYFDSMFHSVAVVGVNTSALIESGIVGRPVFTVEAEEFAGTQEGTLHFQHLKTVNGGLLSTAESLDQHYEQLVNMLADPAHFAGRGRKFIEAFIRPNGIDQPAAPILADAVQELAQQPRQPRKSAPWLAPLVKPLLYPLALLAQRQRRKRPPAKAEGEAPAAGPLRLLFVMGSPEYLRFFDETLRLLADRGHRVCVAINSQKDLKQARFEAFAATHPNITFLGLVPRRDDVWSRLARAVRGTMDFARYLDPRFVGTSVLRARIKRKALPDALHWLDRIDKLSPVWLRRMLRLLATIERAIPTSGRVARFVEALKVDAVALSPLVDAASPQVDMVRAARHLGLPVIVCIASWDNLTNKGLLRVEPDLVTVWNEIQRREATELHGVSDDKVSVTGAQPFDRWFEREPSRTRDAFCQMLGFDPRLPIVLFTGSSFFISGEHTEVPFVRRWITALRHASDALVRDSNILIRPHPYNADQWAAADVSDFERVAVFPKGRHNPTDEQNRAGFFDSLFHSAAVVGVNTSAMIEAAIIGRPVHAVLTDDFASTQEGTLHFRYLLPEHGGFLRIARSFDAHVQDLSASLGRPDVAREETARFVRSFIRPNGVERPCVPQLADAVETAARARHVPQGDGSVAIGLRYLLWPVVAVTAGSGRMFQRSPIRARMGSGRMLAHRWRKRMTKGVKRVRRGIASPGKYVVEETRRFRARALVKWIHRPWSRMVRTTRHAWNAVTGARR